MTREVEVHKADMDRVDTDNNNNNNQRMAINTMLSHRWAEQMVMVSRIRGATSTVSDRG